MEIRRLASEHYDKLLSLLNFVFTRQNKREMDFEKEMPKMCVRDDEHMGRHIGIFDGERLVACMGIYPFEILVAGEKLLFATTGNIAVHPDYEGQGYMGKMMDAAMAELDRLDVDGARLGGLRSRYNRYGFEACGLNYGFTFTEKNRLRYFPDFKDDVTFKRIGKDDANYLAFTVALYNKGKISLPRTESNAFSCLTMWQNVPYIAFRGDKPIGYICADHSGRAIAEIDATDTASLADIVCAWQKNTNANITFYRQAHMIDSIRLFAAACESFSVYSPSHFKIRRWERVIDAFMKLKASYSPLAEGELYIGIAGYGNLLVFSNADGAGCRLCDHVTNLTLDPLVAARYIFGPLPPLCAADTSALAEAWFPLPLSWNGQDRL